MNLLYCKLMLLFLINLKSYFNNFYNEGIRLQLHGNNVFFSILEKFWVFIKHQRI